MLPQLQEQLNGQEQQFSAVPCNQPMRTILLLGPSRGGKSTISQILRNSQYKPPRPELYSATRQPEWHCIGSLQLIDMPGFCDTQPQSSNFTLSDKTILSMLKQEINNVDLVAFVFSLANGINEADVDSMRLFQSEFPRFTGKMMLIVTHAEEMDEDERHQLVKEFFRHSKIIKYRLKEFFQQGVYFLGSLRYESLQQNNLHAIVREHQNVLQMRKQFIDKCFQAKIINKTYRTYPTYSIKKISSMIIFFGAIVSMSIIYLAEPSWEVLKPVKPTIVNNSDMEWIKVIVNERLVEMKTMIQHQQTLEEKFKNAEQRMKNAEERLKNVEERLENAEERFNNTEQIVNQLSMTNTCSQNMPEVIDEDKTMKENFVEKLSNIEQEDSMKSNSDDSKGDWFGWIKGFF